MESLKICDAVLFGNPCRQELFDSAQSGAEIYDRWMQITETVIGKAQECNALYQTLSEKVTELEDKKNQCYILDDSLKKEYDTARVKLTSVEERLADLQKKMQEEMADIANLQSRIRKLEKDKEVYDILRWIPIVNVVSEIVAAIEGTRNELQNKTRALDDLKRTMAAQDQEKCQTERFKNELKRQIEENQNKLNNLEQQIKELIDRRKKEAEEMIAWKDREMYCKELAAKIQHLVAIEADLPDFEKLLLENPPTFELAA